MFFSSKIIAALTDDHKKLKNEIEILNDLDQPLSARKKAFLRLVPSLSSHTKREERVIYNFMKRVNEDLKYMALEGEEEHLIVARLVEDMKSNNLFADEWSAKGKVLSELIDHHVKEEEQEVFPLLKKHLDSVKDEELSRQYEISRAEVSQESHIRDMSHELSNFL